jgi:transposase
VLRERLEKLARELEQAQKRIEEQQGEIEQQAKEIRKLEKELAEARKNSTNSSKPPSSDGLAGPQRVRGRKGCASKSRSLRKPGGQKGHPGHHRKLVEPERVSQVVEVLPEVCCGCGEGFAPEVAAARRIGEPVRHQVIELPPMPAWITEYRRFTVGCANCGRQTQAAMPEEAKEQFGPRLTALVGYMTVACRMPRRVVQRYLETALNIELSLGSTQKCWEQVSEAVEGPCLELERQLASEPVLNVDETGWRQNGEKRWIWALVANSFTFYAVMTGRGAEALAALLGAVFAGTLCSDRLPAYTRFHQGKAQFCWAHLKRNLQAILDQSKHWQQERFARDALALCASLFRLWWKFRGGIIDRDQLIRRSQRIRRGFRALAEKWWDCEHREVANMANAIGKHFEKLFCFFEEPGVEPTNNRAEQALRTAVQWRKTSFGNRSDAGALATARLLTVSQTCTQQRRNTLGYLTEAVSCYRRRKQPPSLLAGQ